MVVQINAEENENIEQKILDSATNLFQAQGFDHTDMKMIAQEAGTGVGNIYNYYENKPKLFMEVGRNWRKRLVKDLESILAEDLPARVRVTKLLIALYENVEAVVRHLDGVYDEKPKSRIWQTGSGD